jgi:hypothetical protein
MSELVERLELFRADRPDEWQMDEFIRLAKELEQERNKWEQSSGGLMSEFSDLEGCPECGYWQCKVCNDNSELENLYKKYEEGINEQFTEDLE